MTLKEYKERSGLTARMLAEKIQEEVDRRYTLSLVSNMVTGLVEPPHEIRRWLAVKEIEAEQTPMTIAEEAVLQQLSVRDRQNPVTRSELSRWTGLADRMSREAIEGLRSRGYWIVNGEGGGYYITTEREELERWLLNYTARARTIYKVAAAMRAKDPAQVTM